MPKIVDHERRREEIVDGFLAIVARDGYDKATTRALADELGVATGALWHYFKNFDAVVQSAAERASANTMARIDQRTAGLRGLALIRGIVAELLPFAKETRDEAAIVVAFWGRSAAQHLRVAQLDDEAAWEQRLGVAIEQAIEDGELVPTTPVADLQRLLRSTTLGQQVYEIMHPEEDTAPEHRAVADAVLAPWLA